MKNDVEFEMHEKVEFLNDGSFIEGYICHLIMNPITNVVEYSIKHREKTSGKTRYSSFITPNKIKQSKYFKEN